MRIRSIQSQVGMSHFAMAEPGSLTPLTQLSIGRMERSLVGLVTEETR